MICRVLQDWTPLKWFPLIETRITGVFLESNPNVPYDMVPCLTDWRFRRCVPPAPTTGDTPHD